MNYVDIFLGIVLVIGMVKGYLKGFVVEVLSFLGLFVGLYAAIQLTVPVCHRFFAESAYFQLVSVGVFIALFVAVILLIGLVAKAVKKVIDITFLGLFDNLLGALASGLKVAFILSVLLWVMNSVGVSLPQEMTDGSRIFPFIQILGPKIYHWVSLILPFIRDMIDSLENIHGNSNQVYTLLMI